MNKINYMLAIATIALSGCAAMYGTPEQRQKNIAALPDYSLCRNFGVAVLAPQEIRAEWAIEIQRRGVDCRKYSDAVNNELRMNQQLMNTGGYMMQQPSGAVGVPTSGVTCTKKREWVSGLNKNCVYDCLGSEAVQTIGATQLCPLSITR